MRKQLSPSMMLRLRRIATGASVLALVAGVGLARTGVAIAATTKSSSSTASSSTAAPPVWARASASGKVTVSWTAPSNATGFDVSRSDGVSTTDLTPSGTVGHEYVDETATGGVSYTYTVTVTKISASATTPNKGPKVNPPAAQPSLATVGEQLGSARVTAIATKTTPSAPSSTSQPAGRLADAASSPLTATPPPSAPHPAITPNTVVPLSCQLSGTQPTETLSPTPCPSGYEVTADVLIPTGFTVTVDPGTVIYVDPGTDPTPIMPTSSDPTTENNIIVDGSLVTKGTSANGITFTSTNAYPGDPTTTLPATGDWGDIFYDHEGTDLGSGALSYVTVSYGSSVVAAGFNLPVSNSVLTDMSGKSGAGLGTASGESALYYREVPASSTVTVSNLQISDNSTTGDYGLGICACADTNFAGVTYNGGSITVSVQNSSFSTPEYPLWAEVETGGTVGAGILHLNVVGDTAQNTSSSGGYGEYWYAENDSSAAGEAAVEGTVSNNEVSSEYYGIEDEAYNVTTNSSTSSTPTNCESGNVAACEDVDFSDDTVSSYYEAFDAYAVSDGSGNALDAHQLNGGQYRSYDSYADYSYSETEGTSGSAFDSAKLTDTYIQSAFYYAEEGAYTEATSGTTAISNPTVSGSKIYGSSDEDEYVFYNEAENTAGGSTTANPTVTDSVISSPYYADYAFYNLADSTIGGNATANPSITGSTFSSYYEDVYDYAEVMAGNGSASSDPTITGSTLAAYDDYALDVEAYGDGTGTSTVAPTVSSTGISAGSDGVYLEANPTASGAGTVAGTFSSSPISATSDGVEMYSEGSGTDLGAANITTTFTNEVVNSGDTGYYAEAYTYGSPAKVAPTVSGGSVTSPDDDAFDLESYVEGGSTNSAQTTPSISSNTSGSYYGIYLLSEQDSGSSTFGGVTVGGSISDSSVLAQYSDEAGVYAEAICYYACTGGANNNLSITGSSVADYYEYGVYLLSEADTGLTDTSPATVSGTISGTHSDSIDAYDSYGIYTEALDSDGSSSGGGTATDSAVISGIHAAGYSGDVYNVAESEYGSANGNSSVTGALLDNGWSAADIFGAEDYTESNMSATNSSAVASGSNGFSNNTVTGFTGTTSYGLNWQLYGSGGDHEIPAATISGNTLTNIDGNGIYAETDGNTSNGTSYVAPSIENNTLNGIGEDGIYLEDVDPSVVHNTVSNAGLEGTATKSTGTYTSQDGLYVLDAPTQGSVRCNTLSGSPVGIGYDTNVSDPLTNDNNFANASNVTNSPFNLMSNLPSPGVTNATSNWWGHYPVTQTDASVLNTSTGSINITPMLTSMSTCTS